MNIQTSLLEVFAVGKLGVCCEYMKDPLMNFNGVRSRSVGKSVSRPCASDVFACMRTYVQATALAGRPARGRLCAACVHTNYTNVLFEL